jgi:hypothetical protein
LAKVPEGARRRNFWEIVHYGLRQKTRYLFSFDGGLHQHPATVKQDRTIVILKSE